MSSVVSRIALDALGERGEGTGLVEFRFINQDGATEVWMVEPSDTMMALLRAEERVKLAYIDSGVDVRVGLLTESRTALQDHVASHHEELTALYQKEFGVSYACRQFAPGSPGASAQA